MNLDIFNEELHGAVIKKNESIDKVLVLRFQGMTITMHLTPEELKVLKRALE